MSTLAAIFHSCSLKSVLHSNNRDSFITYFSHRTALLRLSQWILISLNKMQSPCYTYWALVPYDLALSSLLDFYLRPAPHSFILLLPLHGHWACVSLCAWWSISWGQGHSSNFSWFAPECYLIWEDFPSPCLKCHNPIPAILLPFLADISSQSSSSPTMLHTNLLLPGSAQHECMDRDILISMSLVPGF